ncbi:FAD-binding oxidoreductase [Inquilinus limosus]|uniref:NAD(P)/FAD-dependent oxidoreductase n=1 Tax=Inquilinus limosus TaxID=171674 RepID=UPI003F13AD05
MQPTSDAIVIGGGLQGCSTALHLARRGLGVTVIEKDYVGRHASGVNAGGVRTLGRALPELPLSVAAKALWRRMEALVDDDCGFRPSGQVRVAETVEEMEGLGRRSRAVDALGLNHREAVIDRPELRRLLPAVAPHCLGGLHVADDGFADPFRTTTAFRRAAEREGVRIVEGAVVTAVTRPDRGSWRVTAGGEPHDAALLFNCAGAWGGRLAAALGDAVPLAANGSMMMVTARMPRFVGPVVGAAGRALSFKQFENGTVLIGGGHRAPVDLDSNATAIDVRALSRAAGNAAALFPIMARASIVRFWSGIEGFTPDGLPVLGPSAAEPGAFHAFGFSAHGFQLGPVVGRILAELALDGTASLPVAPFRVDRFRRDPASAGAAGTMACPTE